MVSHIRCIQHFHKDLLPPQGFQQGLQLLPSPCAVRSQCRPCDVNAHVLQAKEGMTCFFRVTDLLPLLAQLEDSLRQEPRARSCTHRSRNPLTSEGCAAGPIVTGDNAALEALRLQALICGCSTQTCGCHEAP